MLRRWSATSKLFAVLAVASGALAFTIVRGYEQRLERLRPVVGTPVPVVTAAASLTRGTVLLETSLRVAEIPSRFAPPGAFSAVDALVGRTLVADVAAGEALTRTRLAAPGAGPVAALVPPGLRAFPVHVVLPSAAVGSGDAVDVLATFGGRQPHTETVVSGVEVLEVLDPSSSTALAPAQASSTLVVLVTPDDAERLAFATAFGSLSVAIAPPGA